MDRYEQSLTSTFAQKMCLRFIHLIVSINLSFYNTEASTFPSSSSSNSTILPPPKDSPLATLPIASFSPDPCPTDWVQFNTCCFYLVDQASPLSWSAAESGCQELHPLATLPSILSQEEDHFLGLFANSTPFWLGGSREVWSDYGDSASWTWRSGATVNFTNWKEGQPNNYLGLGERCIRYLTTGWDDHRCGKKDANTLICKLELNYGAAGEGPRALYHDQTVAVVTFNGPAVNSCQLILAETLQMKVAVLKELVGKMPVGQRSFEDMLTIVRKCQDIQKAPEPSLPPSNYWDLAYGALSNNGVLPGTLWCGKDDIAKSYSSLGTQWRLDKCCRAHDHCPVKVKNIALESFKPRYGILNNGLTKSHCDCDDHFYDCLKQLESEWGNVVGDVFFNALAMECLDNNGTEYTVVTTKRKY